MTNGDENGPVNLMLSRLHGIDLELDRSRQEMRALKEQMRTLKDRTTACKAKMVLVKSDRAGHLYGGTVNPTVAACD
jgi:hypothetical protein